MSAKSAIICYRIRNVERLHLWSVILAAYLLERTRLRFTKWLHFSNGWHRFVYWRLNHRIFGWQVTITGINAQSFVIVQLHRNVLLCIFFIKCCLPVLHCHVFGGYHNWGSIQYYWCCDNYWFGKADQINGRKCCWNFSAYWRLSGCVCCSFAVTDWCSEWGFYFLHFLWWVSHCWICALAIVPYVMENIQIIT